MVKKINTNKHIHFMGWNWRHNWLATFLSSVPLKISSIYQWSSCLGVLRSNPIQKKTKTEPKKPKTKKNRIFLDVFGPLNNKTDRFGSVFG
jgi:hypothetical protein